MVVVVDGDTFMLPFHTCWGLQVQICVYDMSNMLNNLVLFTFSF